MAKIKDIHLIAFYTQRPRAGVNTSKKGWMQNPDNFQYDERIEFTKGLDPKDHQVAGVILNLNQKKLVRNRFGDSKTFDDLFKYFLEAYPQYVIQVMAQLDMEYLEQFIPKEEEAEARLEEAMIIDDMSKLHNIPKEEIEKMVAEAKDQ